MKKKLRMLLAALVAVIGASAIFGIGTSAQAGGHKDDRPWVCHPVNGQGSSGAGWNLIHPDQASSHIDEATGMGKHTSSDGRTDQYAVNGRCPDPPTETTEPPPPPTIVTPAPVTFVDECGVANDGAQIPSVEGVVYLSQSDSVLGHGFQTGVDWVKAVPADGYTFPSGEYVWSTTFSSESCPLPTNPVNCWDGSSAPTESDCPPYPFIYSWGTCVPFIIKNGGSETLVGINLEGGIVFELSPGATYTPTVPQPVDPDVVTAMFDYELVVNGIIVGSTSWPLTDQMWRDWANQYLDNCVDGQQPDLVLPDVALSGCKNLVDGIVEWSLSVTGGQGYESVAGEVFWAVGDAEWSERDSVSGSLPVNASGTLAIGDNPPSGTWLLLGYLQYEDEQEQFPLAPLPDCPPEPPTETTEPPTETTEPPTETTEPPTETTEPPTETTEPPTETTEPPSSSTPTTPRPTTPVVGNTDGGAKGSAFAELLIAFGLLLAVATTAIMNARRVRTD